MHAVPLEIEADGERFDLRSLMVLIFNGETAGGFHLARRSSIRDGLLDCILLEKKNILHSTFAMGQYLLGGNPKIVRHLQARRIDIRSTVNEPTDVDGQRGAEFPLHIECLPGALRVQCPPVVGGVSGPEVLPCMSRPGFSGARGRSGRPFSAFPVWSFGGNSLYLSESAIDYMAEHGKTGRAAHDSGRESLHKVSISRIKKEMSDVFYLSDDLVIATLSAQNNTTADYPATIDGFSAIIMMAGEATVSIDMKTYQVRPNTIVFFQSQQHHPYDQVFVECRGLLPGLLEVVRQ